MAEVAGSAKVPKVRMGWSGWDSSPDFCSFKTNKLQVLFFHDKKKMKMKIMMVMMMMIEPSGRFMKKRKLCYNQLIQHGWGIPQKMEVPSWEHPKKFGIFIKHCEPEIPSGKLA